MRRIGYLLVIWMCAASAQAGQSDLALAYSLWPGGHFIPGQATQLTLTVTNLGPDIAGGDATALLPVMVSSVVHESGSGSMPLLFSSVDPVRCRLEYEFLDPSPGDRPGLIYELFLPRLLVGETLSCVLNVEIATNQSLATTVHWSARSAADADPDPSNNALDVVFGSIAVSVPTMSAIASTVLVLSLMGCALVRTRRPFP